MNMCNALVMPYSNYCCKICGNTGIVLVDKIQKLQNRVARVITFSNYEIRSSMLLDELGWERLEISGSKLLCVCIYKVHNNLSPSYLRRFFANTANVPACNLRNSEINFHIPRPRTEFRKRELTVRIKDLFCVNLFIYYLLSNATSRFVGKIREALWPHG